MTPKPGQKIEYFLESIGNRHKKGAARVCIKINVTLTFEPDEADQIAEYMINPATALPEHLQETYELLEKFCAPTVKKKRSFIQSLKDTANMAWLMRWSVTRERNPGIDRWHDD